MREFLLREAYVLDIEERRVLDGLYYVALIANLNHEATSGLFTTYPVFAHATDVSYEQAFSRAAGEFVERYSFLIYDEAKFIRNSVLDLEAQGRTFLSPLSFEQREATGAVLPSTDFLWTKAVNLCTNAAVTLPAQLVFWNYDTEHRTWSEPLLRERNSCGLASGYTRDVAIRSALYELIQRDAFFTYWFTRTSPRRIELDEAVTSERFSTLVDWCRKRSIISYFMEVTADIPVPTILCMLCGKEDEAVLALGFGTSFDIHAALESALAEAVGLYRWTQNAQASGMKSESYAARISEPDWKNHFSAKDRALMWSRPDMFAQLSFLTTGTAKRLSEMTSTQQAFSSIGEELTFVCNILASHGSAYEPLVYTSPHVLPASLSTYAVRVFVPALIPMYMEETGAVSPRSRLEEVHGSFTEKFEINPYPHPFP